jgi:uncharacterized membrane protein YdbT with pleckstrin-like domain
MASGVASYNLCTPCWGGFALSYVEKNLLPGEKILYKTRLHWVVVLGPVLLGLLFGLSGLALLIHVLWFSRSTDFFGVMVVAALGLLLAAAISFGVALLKRAATEMAVTDRRVVVKIGLLNRRTVELLLSKVESIGVEETLFGRIVGYGTVVLRGTGGTPESFSTIAHPLEFRREVQQQIERSASPR